MLCGFEPVKYCIAAPRLSDRHEPQVGLVATANQYARLGFATAEHALDERVADERVHHLRPRRPSRGCRCRRTSRCARRRLPTGMNSMPVAPRCRIFDEAGGDGRSIGEEMTASVLSPFFERLEQQLLLACAHALQLSNPPRLGRRFEVVERGDAQLGVEQRHSLWSDVPAAAAVRGASAEIAPEDRRDLTVPVSQISTMRAERSLPIPGHERSCASVRPATGSGLFATTSAPLRYARILKGSRRSARAGRRFRPGCARRPGCPAAWIRPRLP